MRGKIIGQHLQSWRDRTLRFEIIDRFYERSTKEQRPGAIDGGPAEIRIFRMGDPCRQLMPTGTFVGEQVRGKRHVWSNRFQLLRLAFLDLVLAVAVVDAFEADMRLTEESGKAVEILFHPRSIGMIVTLSTIQSQAEECTGDTAGQAHGIGLIFL